MTHETFVTSSWQPITWPFKLALPVSGALLMLQGISECLKCVHTLRTGQWAGASRRALRSWFEAGVT